MGVNLMAGAMLDRPERLWGSPAKENGLRMPFPLMVLERYSTNTPTFKRSELLTPVKRSRVEVKKFCRGKVVVFFWSSIPRVWV